MSDLTSEQLEGMKMWDRDEAVFIERGRPVWAWLVRMAVDEILHHRATMVRLVAFAAMLERNGYTAYAEMLKRNVLAVNQEPSDA